MFPEKNNKGITLPFKIFVYKLSTINLRCRIVLVFRVWWSFPYGQNSPVSVLEMVVKYNVTGNKTLTVLYT
jgi:hypothetical protein